MRYAIVTNARTRKEIEQYLPDNYRIMPRTFTTTPDGRCRAGISGEDVRGWTLHDYVIPRLASGLLGCVEVATEDRVYDGTTGVMD